MLSSFFQFHPGNNAVLACNACSSWRRFNCSNRLLWSVNSTITANNAVATGIVVDQPEYAAYNVVTIKKSFSQHIKNYNRPTVTQSILWTGLFPEWSFPWGNVLHRLVFLQCGSAGYTWLYGRYGWQNWSWSGHSWVPRQGRQSWYLLFHRWVAHGH